MWKIQLELPNNYNYNCRIILSITGNSSPRLDTHSCPNVEPYCLWSTSSHCPSTPSWDVADGEVFAGNRSEVPLAPVSPNSSVFGLSACLSPLDSTNAIVPVALYCQRGLVFTKTYDPWLKCEWILSSGNIIIMQRLHLHRAQRGTSWAIGWIHLLNIAQTLLK